MSTIVVVAKEGKAVIAADTLTTWGSAKEGAEYVVNHAKILKVGTSYLAISGPTSMKVAINDYLRDKPDIDLSNVDAIFRAWLQLHSALRDQYFLRPEESESDSFESTRADVLIANPKGIFGVSAHRAVQQFSRFYAYGTGWQLALGAMHASYALETCTAVDIAQKAVMAAADFDTDTGLPIIAHSVTLSR